MNKKVIFALVFAVCITLVAIVSTQKNKTSEKPGDLVIGNGSERPAGEAEPQSGADFQSTTTIPIISEFENTSLSDTEKFSRQFFAEYLKAKQGGDYNAPDYQEMLFSAIETATGTPAFKKYSVADIKVINDEFPQTIRNYGNALGRVIKTNTQTPTENELTVFERAINAQNEKELAKLDPIISKYQGIQAGLLTIPVPTSATENHLEIINVLGIMIQGIESMKMAIKDPIKSLTGIRLYPDASDTMISAFNNLSDYFTVRNIQFTPREDGYIITSTL